MNGMEAKRDGDHVLITVNVGDRTARLKVTREYARSLAAELSDAAGPEPKSMRDVLKDAADRVAAKRTDEFFDNLATIMSGKGHAR